MKVCVKCKKEMVCDKNSVGVNFGNGHVYPGDRFKCLVCGYEIIVTNTSPIHDPNLSTQDEYLDMNMGGENE